MLAIVDTALSALILFSSLNFAASFVSQSVWVKGRLRCGDSDARNVLVHLVDVDSAPNPDDFIGSNYTNWKGEFEVKGDSIELSDIDPEIRIYHDCNDLNKPCQREWVIRIPKKYIYEGTVPKEWMDIGTLNLEVELENENHYCN